MMLRHETIRRAALRRIRRAFTLVELLVVIGIVVLLAGLTIAVGPAVFGKSDERLVQNTLTLLDQAMTEWQNEGQKMLSWGVDDTPIGYRFDVQASDTPDDQLVDALNRIARNDVARGILAQIDPDFLQGDVAATTVTITGLEDPWGTPFYIVHPGMVGTDYEKLYSIASGGTLDTDGTVFVDQVIAAEMGLTNAEAYEEIYGRCKNRRVLFVSAGPDGDFGSLAPGALEAEHEATHDNLYSYPPELPQ